MFGKLVWSVATVTKRWNTFSLWHANGDVCVPKCSSSQFDQHIIDVIYNVRIEWERSCRSNSRLLIVHKNTLLASAYNDSQLNFFPPRFYFILFILCKIWMCFILCSGSKSDIFILYVNVIYLVFIRIRYWKCL